MDPSKVILSPIICKPAASAEAKPAEPAASAPAAKPEKDKAGAGTTAKNEVQSQPTAAPAVSVAAPSEA